MAQLISSLELGIRNLREEVVGRLGAAFRGLGAEVVVETLGRFDPQPGSLVG